MNKLSKLFVVFGLLSMTSAALYAQVCTNLCPIGLTSKKYFVSGVTDATSVSWSVNNGAVISSYSGSFNDTVIINFSAATGTVSVSATVLNTCGSLPPVMFNVVINPDCDGDGNPNSTDPNPTVPTALNDMTTASVGVPKTLNILGNDDFLPGTNTSITRTGGTAAGTVNFDPFTGNMVYTPTIAESGTSVTIIYQVCNTSVMPQVCDDATVTITVGDQDTDGDGVLDSKEIADGTDPNNPCQFIRNSVTIASTSTGDCDGDGVTNKDEINGPDGNPLTADGTNPNDPCSLNLAQVTMAATSTGDCDGDGVTNKDEINGPDGNPLTADGTNPNDPCSLNLAQVTMAATSTGDCDGDGVTNKDEINGLDGNPLTADGTNPKDPCSLNLAQVTMAATSTGDCDGDGVTNKDEINGPDGNPLTADGTNPKDPCSLNLAQVTMAATSTGDCDGDGVTNKDEINGPDGNPLTADGTNPKDPCSLNLAQVTMAATSTGDCDGDGVTNKDEINGPDGNPLTADGTNPKDPCSLNLAQVTMAATSTGDCDGDGVTNKDEINGPDGNPLTADSTNPKDPCSYNATQITLAVTSVIPCNKTYPDVNVTNVNILVTGSVATNDDVLHGTTYGTPVASATNPSSSVPVMSPDGSYTFIASVPGVYIFNVPVCAPGQTVNCPLQTLTITVLDPNIKNNPPVVNLDIATTKGVTPVTINTLSNDKSGNASTKLVPSTVSVVEPPRNGTATVDPVTGNITYVAKPGFVGKDTLKYRVCDDATPPNCATAYQIIDVLPTVAPNSTLANDDYFSGKDAVSGNVLLNDRDPEGNIQSVSIQNSTIVGKGTLVLNADGTFTFTPVSGFSGPVEFVYTVCDNGIPQACDKATLYILVEKNLDCDLPNYFSPNGDGSNDFMNLDCLLGLYQNAKVIIYNRWGNIVWRSSGPYGRSTSGANLWYGQLEGSQDLVPDGVYYYLIELEDEFKTTKTGFIEVMRQ